MAEPECTGCTRHHVRRDCPKHAPSLANDQRVKVPGSAFVIQTGRSDDDFYALSQGLEPTPEGGWVAFEYPSDVEEALAELEEGRS